MPALTVTAVFAAMRVGFFCASSANCLSFGPKTTPAPMTTTAIMTRNAPQPMPSQARPPRPFFWGGTDEVSMARRLADVADERQALNFRSDHTRPPQLEHPT